MNVKRLPVNLYRSNTRLILTAPAPGLEPANIRIEVAGRRLSVTEDARGPGQERIAFLKKEWGPGPSRRTITLPARVDAAQANATFDNGVLAIILPVASKGTSGPITMSKVGTAKGLRIRHAGRDLRQRG